MAGITKYFNVEVKPRITGENAVIAFGAGDVMFDWEQVIIPRGSCRLVGITTLVRGTNGARQEFASDVYFAKSPNAIKPPNAPASIGTVNATADGVNYFNALLGAVNIPVTDFRDGLDFMAVSHTSTVATGTGIVMEGNELIAARGRTGIQVNSGHDELFMAVIAQGAFDFNTGSLLNQAGNQAATTAETTLITDGTDATTVFAAGDIIIAQDNATIGTVLSTTATTVVVDGVTSALTNNDELCNKNPITYILHFEK